MVVVLCDVGEIYTSAPAAALEVFLVVLTRLGTWCAAVSGTVADDGCINWGCVCERGVLRAMSLRARAGWQLYTVGLNRTFSSSSSGSMLASGVDGETTAVLSDVLAVDDAPEMLVLLWATSASSVYVRV